jgi:hypothetical protein
VSILAALQLTRQKYGLFTVHGLSAFKEQVVHLAAVHGVETGDEGLEEAVAAERQRRLRVQSGGKSLDSHQEDLRSKIGIGRQAMVPTERRRTLQVGELDR